MGLGVKIVQGLLFAFNFIFVLIGLAGIITGALIRVKYEDYEVLVSKDIGGVSILLIALGGIIFIVAFFGCCGAIRQSVIMLTIFIVLMVVLLVIEIAGAITAYVYKDKVKDYVRDGMDEAFKNYNETKFRDAMDTVQRELKCCGLDGPDDYHNSTKLNMTKLPASCCGYSDEHANCTDASAYHKGCVNELFDYLKEHMAIIGGMAVGVAVIQVIGIVFACVVRRDIKEGYNYV